MAHAEATTPIVIRRGHPAHESTSALRAEKVFIEARERVLLCRVGASYHRGWPTARPPSVFNGGRPYSFHPVTGFVRLAGTEARRWPVVPSETETQSRAIIVGNGSQRGVTDSGDRPIERLRGDVRTPRSLRPQRITQMWLNKALYKVSAGTKLRLLLTPTRHGGSQS